MITSACEKKVKKMLQKLPCINRPPKKMEVVSSLHMRVLSSGNFTQHDCSMDSFGYGSLVLGFFFFFFSRISVVEKRRSPDPLDPPSGSAPGPCQVLML